MTCSACNASELEIFYQAANLPIHSCRMMPTRDAAMAFPRADLALAFCRRCGLIQNTLFDGSLHDYGLDYEDRQAYSPRFTSFLEGLADRLIHRHRLEGKPVIEIGPGAGDFLITLADRGRCHGIGIGPSSRPERLPPEAAGRVELVASRFGPEHFALPAAMVCCRHTLEHIGEPLRLLGDLRRMLADRPGTPVFFEVPDALRILEDAAFWDVYYEHCGYYTAGSLARLFRSAGFRPIRLERDYGDQYLMIEAVVATDAAPGPVLPLEQDLGRIGAAVERFRQDTTTRLASLARDLLGWRQEGKRVVVWGASSKAVAYLTALAGGEEVAAVVDINPEKRGLYLAGTGHRILHPDDLVELRPDVALLTNVIYYNEIKELLAARGLHPLLPTL